MAAPVRILWETGRLWPRLKAQSQHGLVSGALQPIDTNAKYIESGGMGFVVRILANLSFKEKARKQREKTAATNPFLPYEEDLYVTDISKTHLCLLNKFNVVDHHFLIVTRQFEPQENWLTLADFEALIRCLDEVDGLAFFNGGTAAGSSQPHKHLQVVPYPTEEADPLTDFSVEGAIAAIEDSGEIVRASRLPFRHAITKRLARDSNLKRDGEGDRSKSGLAQAESAQTSAAPGKAEQYLTYYRTLLSAVGIASNGDWQGRQTAAYNFLCTREWMMIVPRRQEKYVNVSVNSLGFAGSLLVKDEQTLAQLEAIGPMTLLQKVSVPNE
ncbi:MAG: DUF4922 domain-containing protein [Phormidesmis sp.]